MPFKKYTNKELPVLDKELLSAYFSGLGRKGGLKNKKKGKKYFSMMGKRSAEIKRLKKQYGNNK
jgi:hypothetical protein